MLEMIRSFEPGRGLDVASHANALETKTLAPNPTIRSPRIGNSDSTTTDLKAMLLTKIFHADSAHSYPMVSIPIRAGRVARHASRSGSENLRTFMQTAPSFRRACAHAAIARVAR